MGRLYDLLHSLVGDTKRTKADIEAVQNSIQNLSDTNAELKSDLVNSGSKRINPNYTDGKFQFNRCFYFDENNKVVFILTWFAYEYNS